MSYYDEDYDVSYSKVKSTASYDDLCTFDANNDIFYPGALLDFNTMTPIGIKRAPLTITLNGLEGGAISSDNDLYRTVNDPTLANVKNEIKNLVNSTVKSSENNIPANVTMDIRKIESEEEFNLNLGFGMNFRKFYVNDEFDLTKSKKQTHVAVILKQVYFTVAVSRENERGEFQFFSKDVPNDKIKETIGSEKIPVYCNSVSYGRIAIISISSNYSYEDISNSLKIGFGQNSSNPGNSSKKGISAELIAEFEKLSEDSSTTINAFVYGGDTEIAYGLMNANTIADIANIFSENKEENAESICGLPISYSFRHLDGSLAKIQDSNEYVVKNVKYVPKYLAKLDYLDELVQSKEIRNMTELKIDLSGLGDKTEINRIISIPPNIEKFVLIGDNDIKKPNTTFNKLAVEIASRNTPLTVELNNVNVSVYSKDSKGTDSETDISKNLPFLKCQSDVEITLITKGDVKISGGNNSPAIDVPNLTIQSDGFLTVIGGDGDDEKQGGSAIKANNGTVKILGGNFTLKGGTSGKAKDGKDQQIEYAEAYVPKTVTPAGESGIDGCYAIECSEIIIGNNVKVYLIGGNGGDGGNGGNVIGEGSYFSDAKLPSGGDGGNGGDGGLPINLNTKISLSNSAELYLLFGDGGNGGNGGQGGNTFYKKENICDLGGNGGNGGIGGNGYNGGNGGQGGNGGNAYTGTNSNGKIGTTGDGGNGGNGGNAKSLIWSNGTNISEYGNIGIGGFGGACGPKHEESLGVPYYGIDRTNIQGTNGKKVQSDYNYDIVIG